MMWRSAVLKILLVCLLSLSAVVKGQEKAATRIVALAPHAVEMLFEIGAGDKIIATSDHSDYPEAAKKLEKIGGHHNIQLERILELEPDLIIAWESGNKPDDIAMMEKLGLKVYRSKTKKISDIPDSLMELGKLTGLEEESKIAAERFSSRLAAIQKANSQKTVVPFFYQLWLDPLKTITAGSWINPILTSCGGKNIFPENGDMHYPQVSMESVLLASPEAVIIPSHHGSATVTGAHWGNWPEIPAVKHDHIFFIDGDILHRFAPRVLDGMEEVCKAFDQVRSVQTKKQSS